MAIDAGWPSKPSTEPQRTLPLTTACLLQVVEDLVHILSLREVRLILVHEENEQKCCFRFDWEAQLEAVNDAAFASRLRNLLSHLEYGHAPTACHVATAMAIWRCIPSSPLAPTSLAPTTLHPAPLPTVSSLACGLTYAHQKRFT